MAMELRKLPGLDRLRAVEARFREADPAAIETCLLLLRVASDLFTAFDVHLARSGLSRGRFMVLMCLLGSEEADGRDTYLTPGDLAARTGVTGPTISGLVRALEEGGLVERAPDPADRRRVAVRLTHSGRGLLGRMLPDHFRRVSSLMGALTDAQKRSLVAMLGKIEAGIPAIEAP